MGFPLATHNVEEANHVSPQATVGSLYSAIFNSQLAVFRYVQISDLATVDGDVLNWANATGTAVTKDRVGGSAIQQNCTAGVAVNAITANYYGYILVSGYHNAVKTDGAVTVGDYLVAMTGNNGLADTMADGEEEQVFGLALTIDTAASVVPAIVRCL